MVRVGLTGGIGSGKSTVARAFEALGARVYQADARAKELLVSDAQIAAELTQLLGPEAYKDGVPDRAWIASRVFADKELLAQMNAIVHPRVAADWEQFSIFNFQFSIVIMEAAILFESGMEGLVDYVVTVEAPVEQRVARAAARDGVAPESIRQRMAHQMSQSERAARADFVIDNSDGAEVLPQIINILHEIRA
jgi:dephospho-CoA kinase